MSRSSLALAVALSLFTFPTNAQAPVAPQAIQFPCDATVPNGERVGDFPPNHRNGNLAVWLPPDGKWTFRPGNVGFTLPDGAMGLKWAWFRLIPGQLVIEGRRLDTESLPLRAEVNRAYGNLGFQPTYLIFPTAGCWEVTGRVGESVLRFVVEIEKLGNGPSLRTEPL